MNTVKEWKTVYKELGPSLKDTLHNKYTNSWMGTPPPLIFTEFVHFGAIICLRLPLPKQGTAATTDLPAIEEHL